MVNTLVTEREALRGRAGTTSLIWINGETFAQLQRERLLSGPWTTSLPNASLVDTTSPIIGRDFEQDPTGYESPWGWCSSHSSTTANACARIRRARFPPWPLDQGASWSVYPRPELHRRDVSEGLMYGERRVERFEHGFDETRYSQGREALFTWLTPLVPYLARGRTYPPDVAAMHRLFANGEIDFTMSNNQNEVVAKVRQGILPSTSRALLLDEGHDRQCALSWYSVPTHQILLGRWCFANFLLSPEAQLEKQRETWG